MDIELLVALEQLAPSHAEGDPAAVQPLQDVLEKLVERSSIAEGRETLGHNMAVERLVSLLPDFSQRAPALRNLLHDSGSEPQTHPTDTPEATSMAPLIYLLKIMRNLCAGVQFNQERFILCGGHDCVAALADRLILSNLQSHLSGSEGKRGGIESCVYNLGRTGSPRRWDLSAEVPAITPGVTGVPRSQNADVGSAMATAEPSGVEADETPILPETRPSSASSIDSQPPVQSPSVPPPVRRLEKPTKSLQDRRSQTGRMVPVPGLSLSPRSSAQSADAFASPLSRFAFAPHPSPAEGASRLNQGALFSLPETLEVSVVTADVLRVVLQLLGNVVGGGAICQVAVWERCFPGMLARAAAVKDPKVQGPLCMLLFNSCRVNAQQCVDLSGTPEGVAIIAAALRAAHSTIPSGATDGVAEDGAEWLEFLADLLCFQNSLLSTLFPKLATVSYSQPRAGATASFTSEQAALLAVLLAALTTKSKLGSLGKPPSGLADSIQVSSSVLEALVRIVDRAAETFAGNGGGESVANPAVNVLACSLKILRLMCAGHSERAPAERSAAEKLIPLVLALLGALPPPAASGGKRVDLPAAAGRKFPNVNLYEGYRRDLVAIIANVVYQDKANQDAVRGLSGLILIMQQCVVEDENPFLREWGLFAMRNLLEGNILNQTEVEELKIQGGAATPELIEMGLKVEVDQDTGKPKLVNIV